MLVSYRNQSIDLHSKLTLALNDAHNKFKNAHIHEEAQIMASRNFAIFNTDSLE